MRVVFKEIKKFWKEFLLLLLTAFGTTAAMMILPLMFKNLIDYSIPQKDMTDIFTTTATMLIFAALGVVCGIFSEKFAAKIAMGVGRNLRSALFTKVQSLSQEEIDKFTTSSLITRSNSDITVLQTFLALGLGIAIMAPIMCVVGMVMAISTSPDLSSVLLFAIPVLAIMIVVIGKVAIPLSTHIQKKLDQINMVIREKLTGVRVIRAFGTSKFEEERFDKINVEYTKMIKKLNRVTALLLPVIIVVLSFTVGLLMYKAVDENLTGISSFTTGSVITMVQYIMIIMGAVIMLTIVFLFMPRAATSANRAKEVLESINKIQSASLPKDNKDKKGYLEFKNVSFTYYGASKPAIKNLSFESKPGETTAIIGGTGMGKSTIINMIPRLYDCSEGSILVDGVNVKDYDLEVLRKKIGFVPQKANLFKGTIGSNIAFGDDNPTQEAVKHAVQVAQSYDFVEGKEKGFDEPVAQGGSNFSGGQKQRLCIARAIVRTPEIYVFDDSFSALDFKTDKTLRKALKSETQEATTIIVAQRVSTIMEADRIIVVDRGEVVGIGKHDELCQTCSVYKEIVDSQMKKEVE